MDRTHSNFTDNNPVARLASFYKIVSDNEQNKPDNNACVTQFNAYHLTGRYLRQDVLDILYKIETTDSVSDLEKSTDQMKELLRIKQNELRDERERLFVIYNKNTTDVYGTLADNIKTQDRDFYIKWLVNYYEIIKCLEDIYKEKNVAGCSLKEGGYKFFYETQDAAMILLDDTFSMNSVRLYDSSSLYGDLAAVHNMMSDMPSTVPDFTFNSGCIQSD